MATVLQKVFLFLSVAVVLADYWENRADLMRRDRSFVASSALPLNEKEEKANAVLMHYKFKEYDDGFANPENFPPAQHFFKAKPAIENSAVFKIIRKVPKGASLHSHTTATVSQEYLYNLTYEENLHACVHNGELNLRFFHPTNVSDFCEWRPVRALRSDSGFDDFIKSKISLVVDDPKSCYPSLNSVWAAFEKIFQTIAPLVTYKPVWQDYFYQVLEELYEDNVMYMEFRNIISEVYDLEGNIYDGVQAVGFLQEVLDEFKEKHPGFHGARIILAPGRAVTNDTMDFYVETFFKMRERYPDFLAGFDLVGQEDKGRPLVDFVDHLLKLKEAGAKFFFHAGETNWNGASTDFNLLDAVLLNTTRIGHGYAILKHPAVQKIMKERGIAIEICPISNQVLMLVDDLRNHPGAVLMANGFPVVVTPDDPSFWGAKGLSYDWYMAFMGMASREDDLRFLKQLAINSIQYSAMEPDEKESAMRKWQADWDKFIDAMLSESLNEILQ